MFGRSIDWDTGTGVQPTLTAGKDDLAPGFDVFSEVVHTEVATPYSRCEANVGHHCVRLL
jgi:hypothetical protein